MSVVITDLPVDTYDDSGSDTRVTGSITIPSGQLGIITALVVNDYQNEMPVLSLTESNGLTLVPIAQVNRAVAASAYEPAIAAWYAIGTGVAGTFEITSTATHIRRWLTHFHTVTGFNTSSPIGAIGTSSALASSGAASMALSGITGSNSQTLAYLIGSAASGAPNITEGAGWDEFYDTPSSGWYATQAQFFTGATNQVDWAETLGSGSYDKGPIGLAFEIKEALTAAADLMYPRKRTIVVDRYFSRS